jgi:hypothetical protein
MPGKAFTACENLYAQNPQAAQPLDDRDQTDRDQTMLISLGGQPHDLVRHVCRGRRVFYRLYPAGAYRGTEIHPDGRVPAGIEQMLATARPLR